MKVELEVAVNTTIINKKTIQVDLPEKPIFFYKNDGGNFFPRGLILFAIIPRYEDNPTHSYMIYEIERNKQNSNDFVPTADCKSEYFLKGGIRRTAYEIITNKSKYFDWKEITEGAFLTIREDLLTIENLTDEKVGL